MKSLQRVETVIIAVLVLIFLVWSYDACSSRRKRYQPQEPPASEQPAAEQQPTQGAPAADNAAPATTNSAPATTTPAPTTAAPAAPAFSTVYVHVAGLKLRDKATLSGSQVLAELPKGAALYYLNNKTTYNDQITLDNVAYNEPWIEVQTTDSRQIRGWVYAGGVRFYQ